MYGEVFLKKTTDNDQCAEEKKAATVKTLESHQFDTMVYGDLKEGKVVVGRWLISSVIPFPTSPPPNSRY